MQLVQRSRTEMLKRALGGANAWVVPTSRAKLLKKAVTPKSSGQKRVEGVLSEIASGAGKTKTIAKLAAGGTVAYIASKAVEGAGSVVMNASRRRIKSLSGSDGPSSSNSSGSSGSNSSARKPTATSTGSGKKTAARKGSTARGKSTGSGKKTAARKKSTARKKPTARKKSTSRKSTARKKATSRSS